MFQILPECIYYPDDYSSNIYEEEKQLIFFIAAAKDIKVDPKQPHNLVILSADDQEFFLEPLPTDEFVILIDVQQST